MPRDHPTNVRVAPAESGLPIETVFLGFQIRSLGANRFPNVRVRRLSQQALEPVEAAVRYCLGL